MDLCYISAANVTCFIAQQFVLASNYKPLRNEGHHCHLKAWCFSMSCIILAFFLCYSESGVSLLAEILPTSTRWTQFRERDGQRHVERADNPEPAALHTCDPPPIPQRPLYRDTGRQAGRQAAFSGALSCVHYCTRRALRGYRSLLPIMFISCCQNMVS